MSERSRSLEIASCVIAIVVGSLFIFMGISSIITVSSSEFTALIEDMHIEFMDMGVQIEYADFMSMFKTIMYLIIAVYFIGGVTLVVLPSFILKRVKNAVTMRKLRKAHTIVTGVGMFLMFFGGLGADIISFIALGGLVASFILENAFLKKNRAKRVIYITPAPPVDPFTSTPSGMPDIFSSATKQNGMPDIFGDGAEKSDTLDEKIADLKKLKEQGVIDEEQYARAVEKIITEESKK